MGDSLETDGVFSCNSEILSFSDTIQTNRGWGGGRQSPAIGASGRGCAAKGRRASARPGGPPCFLRDHLVAIPPSDTAQQLPTRPGQVFQLNNSAEHPPSPSQNTPSRGWGRMGGSAGREGGSRPVPPAHPPPRCPAQVSPAAVSPPSKDTRCSRNHKATTPFTPPSTPPRPPSGSSLRGGSERGLPLHCTQG